MAKNKLSKTRRKPGENPVTLATLDLETTVAGLLTVNPEPKK